MVILTLGGGLGNQMFQYAFARKLQQVTGDEDMKFTGYHLKNTGNREDMLFHLNIRDGISLCDERETNEVAAFQEPLLKGLYFRKKLAGKCALFASLPGKYAWALSGKGFFTTSEAYMKQEYKGIQADAGTGWSAGRMVCNLDIKYVEGNFQTYAYWADMLPELLEELRVKTAPSPENERMIAKMQSCESVCVHIRRGDYLAPEYKHLNVCDKAYYEKAMSRMQGQKPNAVFYIFSNNRKEIEWIRANYDFSAYNVRYVDLNNPDYEELRLMYSCRHFIISNSTFSWWGQMLSENEDKIVIAPSAWNRQCRTDGIYMPQWQLIEV